MGASSSGEELVDELICNRDPASSGEEFGSQTKKPLADETGDRLPFGVFESIVPSISDPIAGRTEVGDWFS
jgi:hypothetical protein